MPPAEDDYWQNSVGSCRPTAKDTWLRLENIRGVGSLGRQIGKWPKQTMPDTLRDTLFGRLPSDHFTRDNEIGLRTYALLDAGKAPMVPEMLTSSGVAWRGLFQGDAQDRLGSVAPYLAELREDDMLLRRLFTDTDHEAGLWRSNCAVFLRSPFDLANVVRHLRKLYKIKDPAGEVDIYLRFWAPETLRTLAPVLVSSQTQASRFCSNVIHSVTWRKSNDIDFTTIQVLRDLSGPAGLILDADLEQRFDRAAAARRARRLKVDAEALIAKRDSVAAQSMLDVPPIRRMCHARHLERMGIRSPTDAAALLSIIYLTRMNILTEPAFHYATRNPFLAPQAKVRQLSLAYAMIARIQKEG